MTTRRSPVLPALGIALSLCGCAVPRERPRVAAPATLRVPSPAALDERAIVLAAENGDIAAVRRLLAAGVSVNALSQPDNRTALFAAAVTGHLEVAQLLVESGAAVDFGGRTPPLVAALEGGRRLRVARYLLEHGADVSVEGGVGFQPLLLAAGRGDPNLVRVLLERGAYVHVSSFDSQTPLFVAAREGDPESVRLLLDAGAAPEGLGESQPLLTAALRRHRAIAVLLRERGADPTRAFLSVCAVDDEGAPGAAALLLELGADPLALNSDGQTALMRAAHQGTAGTLRLLLDRGADVRARDPLGRTALHHAFRAGCDHEAQALTLLESGAEVDARDGAGRTPLMFAARAGCGGGVNALVRWGAQLNLRDADGTSALQFAAPPQAVNALDALLEAGADPATGGTEALALPGAVAPSSFFRAVLFGDAATVERYLAGGGTPNIEGTPPGESFAEPALVAAAGRGETGLVRRLLAAGAAIDLRSDGGETALLLAARGGHRETARALLERGASARTSGYRLSATAELAGLGDLDLVRAALDRGGDPHLPGLDLRRPIQVAAETGNPEVLELLLARGASPNPRDGASPGPLALAAQRGDAASVAFLCRSGADVGRAILELSDPNRAFPGESLGLLLERAEPRDLERRTLDGKTPLIRVARRGSFEALALLARGADALAKSWRGRTALHEAAEASGNDGLVERLIVAGSPVDARDVTGATPLMLAAASLRGSRERTEAGGRIVPLLLARGAAITAVDGAGDTPLHYAARAGNTEEALQLLARGADPGTRNAAGLQPIDLAGPRAPAALRAALLRPQSLPVAAPR